MAFHFISRYIHWATTWRVTDPTRPSRGDWGGSGGWGNNNSSDMPLGGNRGGGDKMVDMFKMMASALGSRADPNKVDMGPFNVMAPLVNEIESECPETFTTPMAIEVTLQKTMVSAVIGRKGETINMIEKVTGAKLSMAADSGGDQRTLTITGKPVAVYAGHLLAMSRVLLAIREQRGDGSSSNSPHKNWNSNRGDSWGSGSGDG